MEIVEILERVRKRYLQLTYPPKSNDPLLGKSLVKESGRKIGSWRKVLWLAGAMPEERKTRLSPVMYKLRARRQKAQKT